MSGTTTNDNRSKGKTVLIGSLLLGSGLGLNYLFEHSGIFRVWENSPYEASWLDGIYPPVCVLLSLTGIALLVGGAMSHADIRRLLRQAFVIVIPLTILYALFTFAVHFVMTGADRLGECPGLDQAAVNSNVIPESPVLPGRPAVGCGVERRGIFLSYYNSIGVFGVTDAAAQQRVLDEVSRQVRQAHTHPVRVLFYESENWLVHKLDDGRTFGSRGPRKLIRVVDMR